MEIYIYTITMPSYRRSLLSWILDYYWRKTFLTIRYIKYLFVFFFYLFFFLLRCFSSSRRTSLSPVVPNNAMFLKTRWSWKKYSEVPVPNHAIFSKSEPALYLSSSFSSVQLFFFFSATMICKGGPAPTRLLPPILSYTKNYEYRL